MSEVPVTVIDVAKKAGVSVMTVSRALSGRGYVAEKTREKVLAVAAELGYAPNLSAKVLKGSRTNVLGLMVSSLESPLIADIIGKVSNVVKRSGRDLLIYNAASLPDMPSRPDVGRLLRGVCDGLLLVLPGSPDSQLAFFEQSPEQVPVVLVGYCRAETALPVVRADNYQGARAATAHLLELGHRRIAFLAGTAFTGQSQAREQGYRDVLAEAGLAASAQVVDGDFQQYTGYEATLRLLAQPQPPTAIFAANDFMAFGAMDAIKASGLRVPEDISVLGFDDVQQAGYVFPRLSTVRQPFADISEQAVRLLIQRIEHPEQDAQTIELPSELVLRDSTGPAPAAG